MKATTKYVEYWREHEIRVRVVQGHWKFILQHHFRLRPNWRWM